MPNIKVEAGDFRVGKFSNFSDGFSGVKFVMATEVNTWHGPVCVDYQATEVDEITEASEENVKRMGGTVGWGVAGAVLLGPVGLLAGLLMGGRGKSLTFVCRFKDGKKFLGTTDSKTYKRMIAATF